MKRLLRECNHFARSLHLGILFHSSHDVHLEFLQRINFVILVILCRLDP
jgi:hypothetical protein